jgi:hypothetical protein
MPANASSHLPGTSLHWEKHVSVQYSHAALSIMPEEMESLRGQVYLAQVVSLRAGTEI